MPFFQCSQGYLGMPWFLVWTQVVALRCLTATFHVGFFDHEVKWVWSHWITRARMHTLVIIGASVSEPLSSDLNVNFVCLSVCLSVMDGPSAYRKSLPALILRVLRHPRPRMACMRVLRNSTWLHLLYQRRCDCHTDSIESIV